MSAPASNPLTGTRLVKPSADLQQSVLTAAQEAWIAEDLLGDARLQQPSTALRQDSLKAARVAWATRDALRDRVLAAATAAWEQTPYDASAPIRLLSDEEWAIESSSKVPRRRTFVTNVLIPAAAALLILGVGIAGGVFSEKPTGQNVSASSITVITEQQPMLGVVARSVKKGGFFSDEPTEEVDHYDEWLDEKPKDRKRPRKRSNQ